MPNHFNIHVGLSKSTLNPWKDLQVASGLAQPMYKSLEILNQ
jgi:hypothetical protein